ncbi:MAG: hypothetical protein ASARMPREDX12_002917 [Alectoria sarmentosa]|nr:MAG: hypothetical protein ASARMPREDX12_002917 [Alectoria sarmentosa]CAD6590254.1 MAG: hypothetical protein ASARMPRED_004699 [Alectoria sarmentosa]
MTSAESRTSGDSERSEKRATFSRRRIRSWEHNPPQALVYEQGSPHLAVEEINEVNKESNSFEIQLPRWRNRVHVYADMEEQRGYAATLRLDRLGLKKNWQRRLGINYRVLHVKGKKPVWPY